MTFTQIVVFIAIEIAMSLAISYGLQLIAEEFGVMGKIIVMIAALMMGNYDSSFDTGLAVANTAIKVIDIFLAEKANDEIKHENDKISILDKKIVDINDELESFKSKLDVNFVVDLHERDKKARSYTLVLPIIRPGFFYVAAYSNLYYQTLSTKHFTTKNTKKPKFTIG
jgi:hypothetical protein